MNREGYLKFQEDIFKQAIEITKRKNHDYAGSSGDTPFANFERVKHMGICSVAQGFLVRMTDKLSRLATFASTGNLQVKDESVHDTLIDLMNYSCLLAGYLEHEKEQTGTVSEIRVEKAKTPIKFMMDALKAGGHKSFPSETPSIQVTMVPITGLNMDFFSGKSQKIKVKKSKK